jgi:hypothetical protein
MLRRPISLLVFCLVLVACEGSRSRGGEINDEKGNTDTRGETSDAFDGAREFGDGDYAIIFTGDAEPSKYCWYIKETVRIWTDGNNVERRDSATNICVEGGVECVANEPMGYTNETESSYERVGYSTVSYGALYGSCEQLERYWSDDDESVQCLFHKHCYGGRLCLDYQCACPDGVECTNEGQPGGPSGDPGVMDPGMTDPGMTDPGMTDPGNGGPSGPTPPCTSDC